MSIAQPETVNYAETSDLEHLLNEVMPYEENKDPNRKTHILNAELNQHIGPGLSAKEIVETARLKRIEIIMLCGFVMIPVHNPEKFDACAECVQIAGILMRNGGE